MPVESLTPQNLVENQQFSSKILEFPQRKVSQTYTMDYDEKDALNVNKVVSLPEYRERKERYTQYVLMNMETHLGERFNVNLSTFEYGMKKGQLWGKDMEVPAIESFKRGRDIRRVDGNTVDFAREDAEIEGFTKIQEKLMDPNTPIGTIMLSISPPGLEGTSYYRRFHDAFTLKEKDGKRYVEVKRFASSIKPEEYQKLLKPIANIEIDVKDPAAKLLANPIEIPAAFTADGIHEYLHKDKEFLDEAVFKVVKEECKPLAQGYVKSLLSNPHDREEHAAWFNAYLNKADHVLNQIKTYGLESVKKVVFTNIFQSADDDKDLYGFQPVRKVMTGCGESGGYETQIVSAFGVAEFATDLYGDRRFSCPSCGVENIRPINKMLPKCLHCNSDRVAC